MNQNKYMVQCIWQIVLLLVMLKIAMDGAMHFIITQLIGNLVWWAFMWMESIIKVSLKLMLNKREYGHLIFKGMKCLLFWIWLLEETGLDHQMLLLSSHNNLLWNMLESGKLIGIMPQLLIIEETNQKI